MAEADRTQSREQPDPNKSWLQQRWAAAKQWWQELRIGDGHAAAMGRLGFKELAQALPAFPESTIRPVEEPGVAGNPTPAIVTKEMGFNQMLEGYANRPTPARGPEQERGMSR